MTDLFDKVIVAPDWFRLPDGNTRTIYRVLTHCRTQEEAQVTRALFEAAEDAVKLLDEMHTQIHDNGGVDTDVLNDAAELLDALANARVGS